MFESKGRQPQVKKSDLEHNNLAVFTVYTADALLSGSYFQNILDEINKVADMRDDHFAMLYTPLIYALADYVQVFSSRVGGAADCTFLSKSIRRGLEMMKLAVKQGHEQQDLFNYLCFSAGALINIQRLARNNRVVVCNSAGHYNYLWNPMLSSLTEQGAEHYRVRTVRGLFPAVSESIAVLLAQRLMPERGYDWVSSDHALFAEWLLLIQDPEHARGDLAIIHTNFKQLFPDFDSSLELTGFHIDFDLAEDLTLGEDFMRWLDERIKSGKIDVNGENSPVQMIAEGAFLETATLAKEYAEMHGGTINTSEISRQFRLMFGILRDRRGPIGYSADFVSMSQEAQQRRGAFAGAGQQARKIVTGMVLDASLVFPDRTPPGVSKTWGQRSAANLESSLPNAQGAMQKNQFTREK
jgi:hypothetical protein